VAKNFNVDIPIRKWRNLICCCDDEIFYSKLKRGVVCGWWSKLCAIDLHWDYEQF
jgi:hypothetical protein